MTYNVKGIMNMNNWKWRQILKGKDKLWTINDNIKIIKKANKL